MMRATGKTLATQIRQDLSGMIWGLICNAIVVGFTVLGFRLDAWNGAAVAFVTAIANVAAVYMMCWLFLHVRVPRTIEVMGYAPLAVVGPLLGYVVSASFSINAPLEAALIGFTLTLWFVVGVWHTVSIGEYH